jgi:hypothetical protein
VSGKAGPARTHRGGGATTGRRSRLETAMFSWRAAPTVIGGLRRGVVLRQGRRHGRSGRVMGARGKNPAGDGGSALLKGARRGGNRGGGGSAAGAPCSAGRAWGLAPISRRRGRDRGGQWSGVRHRAEERREDRGGDRHRGHVEEERGESDQPADDARPAVARDRRRGTAMSCCRPNRGGGRGLTGGPWPQCQAAALADRRARAAQCRAVRIQNISNGLKILQTLTDLKGVFPCSTNQK